VILENFSHLVWDFNGTLLNDFVLTVDLVNLELKAHLMPLLTAESYRELFGHPVYKFYERIGFDINNHDFELMSQKFHDDYELRIDECKLHEGAHEVLDYCKALGKSQSVLSALPHDILIKLVEKYSLASYFEHVQGAADSAAHGKMDYAKKWISESNHEPSAIVLIGDTLHDAEVAEAIGASCILIADGFQSRRVLESSKFPVFDKLRDLIG